MTDTWAPKHLLLLDDEISVLFALKLLLGALGFQVEGFSSPREALSFCSRDSTTELCICDLRMPEMTGLEVLAELKTLRPNLPVVLMSAHASDDEVSRAKALGANGFLSKPFTPDDLHLLIAEVGKNLSPGKKV